MYITKELDTVDLVARAVSPAVTPSLVDSLAVEDRLFCAPVDQVVHITQPARQRQLTCYLRRVQRDSGTRRYNVVDIKFKYIT